MFCIPGIPGTIANIANIRYHAFYFDSGDLRHFFFLIYWRVGRGGASFSDVKLSSQGIYTSIDVLFSELKTHT